MPCFAAISCVLLLLGLCAIVFVGACVLGVVENDPETGKPSFSLGGMLEDVSLPDLSDIELPSGADGLQDAAQKAISGMNAWPYAVRQNGLTVKTLRAGKGEAVLVCADGYTMLLGGGSGMGDESRGVGRIARHHRGRKRWRSQDCPSRYYEESRLQ